MAPSANHQSAGNDEVELIAHRAGNDQAAVDALADLVDAVELDVHLHRGRVVVRHAKRVWFTSRLWERWYLLPRGTSAPELTEVLTWIDPEVGLWIDCKGISRRLPTEALRIIGGDRGPITISSKSWWMLGPVGARAGVRTMRSAGNRFELLLLRSLPTRVSTDGVVVHRRLLGPQLVDELRQRHGLVFSWSIRNIDDAHRLMSWGVDGLIIDDPQLMSTL
jgi:glycerophosphoryl diester phosphodiesterase